MPESARQILTLFKEKEVRAGDSLPKDVVLGHIRKLQLDVNDVRNAWHFLMGEGFIRQVGNVIELTNRGESELGS